MATMSARYTVIDGEVIAQERDGVRHQLVPDPLGSTIALYDDSGTKTDTFEYWPYGESAARTGTTIAKFQYVGSFGYYRDSNIRNYVRARYLDIYSGIWITEDPLFPDELAYAYVRNNPMTIQDPSGMQPRIDSDCSSSITGMVKQYCKIIRKPWPNGVRDKINNCIRKAATKNGVSCNGSTPERVECMRNWCRNGALKCCRQGDRDQSCREYCTPSICAYTPGFVRCLYGLNPKAPVGPTIYFCVDNINSGGCGNFNPNVPPYPHVFFHELGHACGIAHVDESHDKERQCNDIFACCMYEVLVRRTNGDNCKNYVPRTDLRY